MVPEPGSLRLQEPIHLSGTSLTSNPLRNSHAEMVHWYTLKPAADFPKFTCQEGVQVTNGCCIAPCPCEIARYTGLVLQRLPVAGDKARQPGWALLVSLGAAASGNHEAAATLS